MSAKRKPKPRPQPEPCDVATMQRATAAAVAAIARETELRRAEIASRLRSMLDKAERGNPAKRDARQAEAYRWADSALVLAKQSAADREAALLTSLRALELADLEALRGGQVVTEARDIETPIVRDGAPVWRGGRKLTKRERVERPRVLSRDGLESLANSHRTADGELRKTRDGRPYAPAIDSIALAAGMRYRELYEAQDPERGLRAVNPESAGGGRAPGEPFDARTVWSVQRRADAGAQVARLEAHVAAELRQARGVRAASKGVWLLREVAGKGTTVYALVGEGSAATRAITTLNDSLSVLAEKFGLA